jgi:hypothetical protein
MEVAIIGASSQLGTFIRDEALARGHQVTAIVRNLGRTTVNNPHLNIVKADILGDEVDKLVKGHDAVISTYNPGWAIQTFTVSKSRATRQSSVV